MLGEELVADAQQPRTGAGPNDRPMKSRMRKRKRIVVALRILRIAFRRFRQPMQRRDQIGLPVDAAVLDGVAYAKPLDLAAHIGEIAQLGEGKRRDAKSALRLEPHNRTHSSSILSFWPGMRRHASRSPRKR